jgi:N-acetylglucosamine malate deacetylase 1
MNPYHHFVSEIARLVREGKQHPLGGFASPAHPALPRDAPRVLIFSPHPDDECIIGGLALRLLRESGMRVINVAVTQGSRQDRQAARWSELRAACEYLGFDLIATAPGGLEKINVKTREEDAAHWQRCVDTIATILQEQQPAAVFFPHDTDWNSTHVGTHHLLMDALARQSAGFSSVVIETEFWGAMASPNLMVESSVDDVAEMIAALSFHAGEVQRNPYHLLVPPWMQDNVRRGGELVGGQGSAAPDFTFCTLYRLRRWSGGQLHAVYEGGRNLPAVTNAAQALSLS